MTAKRPTSSTCVATPAQYQLAQAIAAGKGVHNAPPGELELRRGSWRAQGELRQGDCGWATDRDRSSRRYDQGDDAAQLRTVQVRLTVGAVVSSYGYVQTAGKPKWVPAGVLCRKCGAFWLAPVDSVD